MRCQVIATLSSSVLFIVTWYKVSPGEASWRLGSNLFGPTLLRALVSYYAD